MHLHPEIKGDRYLRETHYLTTTTKNNNNNKKQQQQP